MNHAIKLEAVSTIERIAAGLPASVGAGVKLTRVLTQNLQQRFDPFLILDNFRSNDPNDYLAGFPDHPHRGFETITYRIAGNPLGEPIMQHVPFVVNNKDEIFQAIKDFNEGRLAEAR